MTPTFFPNYQKNSKTESSIECFDGFTQNMTVHEVDLSSHWCEFKIRLRMLLVCREMFLEDLELELLYSSH